jgi:hypothetical protein
MLPDGRRLYMHDGPIDLILEAFGAAPEIRTAYLAATERFVNVLDELCGELPLLRSAVGFSVGEDCTTDGRSGPSLFCANLYHSNGGGRGCGG